MVAGDAAVDLDPVARGQDHGLVEALELGDALVGLREVVVAEGEPLQQLDRRATERDPEGQDAHGSADMVARHGRDLPAVPVTWASASARGEAGPANAITDVAGVRVGHRTVVRGDDGAPDAVRTGVTAVFPHEGDPWTAPVYAATHILNGYGELIGVNTIREWGILESPIVLTSSLLIGKAYDATVRWIAARDPACGGGGHAVRDRVRRLLAERRARRPARRRRRLGRARRRRRGRRRGRDGRAPGRGCSASTSKAGSGRPRASWVDAATRSASS